MTFDDLIFKHRRSIGGRQAVHTFDNDYGVSVIQGYGSYRSNDPESEVAILYKGKLCYNTYLTNSVLSYLTADDVTKVLKQVEEL